MSYSDDATGVVYRAGERSLVADGPDAQVHARAAARLVLDRLTAD